MGIPAYFSYIIKSHPQILLNMSYMKETTPIQQLYMDCNSIIYDVYRECLQTDPDPSFETIVHGVLLAIIAIVNRIAPSKMVYIAFDGVAPLAKMEQQRKRRLRSMYESESNGEKDLQFHTTMITPGTRFMKYLSEQLKLLNAFLSGYPCVMISDSTERGEGEQKLMGQMRLSANALDTVAIYGLDSDLIMLSLFHVHLFKNIYVFREAPEFFKSRIPIVFNDPKEPYFIDIRSFSVSISQEMRHPYTGLTDKMKTWNYVFLCFMLGNDFLPHFPSLNLRTNGIRNLMDTFYRLENEHAQLILWDDTTPEGGQRTHPVPRINWKGFGRYIELLSEKEWTWLKYEEEMRERNEKKVYEEGSEEGRKKSLLNVATQLRGEERYISVKESGWEKRYYKVMLGKVRCEEVNEMCKSYVEGLEWVLMYYSGVEKEGVSKGWRYKYDNAPLLKDVKGVKCQESVRDECEEWSDKDQMEYVLPLYALMREGLKSKEAYMKEKGEEKGIEYHWAYCKYLWEAHMKK